MAIIRRDDGRTLARQQAAAEWEPWRVVRDLLRWDPFREVSGASPFAGVGPGQLSPDFDVMETEGEYVFKADLPGVAEKDIDITMTGNRLTVSGKREIEEQAEGESYFTCERSFGAFSRSFTLPAGSDPENIDADLKEGVLVLKVPKLPEVKARKVTIKH